MQTIALLFPFTVHKYICPPVSKVHAGSFRVSVIRRTLTWTAGSLTCVLDHSWAWVYTRGLGTQTASQDNIFFTLKNSHKFVLLSWRSRGSNLRSFDLESDALPPEPPRHLFISTDKYVAYHFHLIFKRPDAATGAHSRWRNEFRASGRLGVAIGR